MRKSHKGHGPMKNNNQGPSVAVEGENSCMPKSFDCATEGKVGIPEVPKPMVRIDVAWRKMYEALER